MGHNHQNSTQYNRAFAIGTGLNLAFVVTEFVFGYLSHSLALIADAGHNLGDVAGLVLAWGAIVLSQRQPTPQRTYGWRRSSILAAVANAVLLLVAVGAIGWEAVRRFGDPVPLNGKTVIVVAAVGIFINAATAWLFLAGRAHDINIRGAFLHMAADAGVSAGVVVAGFGIMATGWAWIDSAVSLGIAGVILVSTWELLRDSVNLSLDAVPEGVEIDQIHQYLKSLPSCRGVHDLHIWGMSTTETALTAHLVMDREVCDDAMLTQIAGELHDRFGIEHTTLQVENADLRDTCYSYPDLPASMT